MMELKTVKYIMRANKHKTNFKISTKIDKYAKKKIM